MVKCPRCDKTVYANEAVKVAGGDWHSGCVRCRECQCSLNVKTAIAEKGDVYCKVHIPKPKATTVADDVMSQHAKQAQATKSNAKENAGASGAIHQNMRKHDGAVVDAAHGVAKAQTSAPAASYGGDESAGGGQEYAAEHEPQPEYAAEPEQQPEAGYDGAYGESGYGENQEYS